MPDDGGHPHGVSFDTCQAHCEIRQQWLAVIGRWAFNRSRWYGAIRPCHVLSFVPQKGDWPGIYLPGRKIGWRFSRILLLAERIEGHNVVVRRGFGGFFLGFTVVFNVGPEFGLR